MNIHQIKQFVCVAKCGSYTKASEELFMTQQAVSKSIQNLETELMITLFRRNGTGVEATPVGNKLLPVAEYLITQYEASMGIIKSIAEQESDTITIAYENMFLPYAIPADLTANTANLNIRSIISNGIEHCVRDVLDGKADIGFTQRPDNLAGLEYVNVISEPIVFLMNKNHYLAKQKELRLFDLKNVPQGFSGGNVALFSSYINECLKEGFYPNFVYEASDLDLALRNIEANNLVQFASSFALTEQSSENLVMRPLIHHSLWLDLGFIYIPNSISLKVKSFMNAVLSYYKN